MSLTTSEMTPADIAAVTNNNGGGFGFGNDGGAWWIIILFLFVFCGWGRNGFGGGSGGGVTDGYVLASDFANIERKIDGVNNGLCSGFYQEAQLVANSNQIMSNGFANAELSRANAQAATMQSINGLSAQLAQCCCDNRAAIADVNYNIATTGAGIQSSIKDCCCEQEKMAMQSRFDAAQSHCATLQAIDKMGDRIIDYLSAEKAQSLRDENQALRLAASQSMQNQYLINALRPAPVPAFNVPNPYQYSGCGCNC